jgi:spore coat polysaccharide biosynthesis protein SpsF
MIRHGVAVVQARMRSERLPGKVLLELEGRPCLEWVLEGVRLSNTVDAVVVATTDAESDDPIEELARDLRVAVVRGSEQDVLSRFLLVLERFPAKNVFRVTADCPLVNGSDIDRVLGLLDADPGIFYASNTLVRTLPRGFDVEGMRADILKLAGRRARGYHRSHVTSWLYETLHSRHLAGLCTNLASGSLRVTLDTPEDLTIIRRCTSDLGADSRRADAVVAWFRANPEMKALSDSVHQKALAEG